MTSTLKFLYYLNPTVVGIPLILNLKFRKKIEKTLSTKSLLKVQLLNKKCPILYGCTTTSNEINSEALNSPCSHKML